MNNSKGPSKPIFLAIVGLLALSVVAGCSSGDQTPASDPESFSLEDLKEWEIQAAEDCAKLDGPDAPIPTEVGDEAHELNSVLAQCPEKWDTPSGKALWELGFANGDGIYHEDYR